MLTNDALQTAVAARQLPHKYDVRVDVGTAYYNERHHFRFRFRR